MGAAAAVLLALSGAASAGPAGSSAPAGPNDRTALRVSGDVRGVHDPALIDANGTYYLFSTGMKGRMPIALRTSRDLVHWRTAPAPFDRLPAWATALIPGATGAWAPDISRVGGRYRLYYAVSTFGSQRSAIGLATAATPDAAAPGGGWRDEGLVLASRPGDGYNAIDPAFARDRSGGEWLAFGSFWGGIQLVALDPATGKPRPGGDAPVTIARRDPDSGPAAREDAIEGAFLFDHGGWYWLVASFDHCCRGAASDYYTVVGRSRAIGGPYLDRAGRAMLAGGGTVLTRAGPGDRFRGPGHAGFLHDARGRDWLVYHAYDAAADGVPTLRVSRIAWDAGGWPRLARRASIKGG